MFLHIGADKVVLKKDVIAILETHTMSSQITKEFLEIAHDEGFVEHIAGSKNMKDDKEKSYLLTNNKIYFSPISCTTLKKRSNMLID